MERLWLARLRWRMRGAWLWPTFAALTVLDGLLIHAWPLSGEGTGLAPALLLSGILNLGAVAVLGPLLGRLVRRRRQDLPRAVAFDYAGTALLAVVAAGLLAVAVHHQGAVMREARASRLAVGLAREYVLTRAPAAYRANAAQADTIRVVEGQLYRTCVPARDAERPLCVLVHLDTDQPTIVLNGHEPNASWAPRGGY